MAGRDDARASGSPFADRLRAVRVQAGMSVGSLANSSKLAKRRILELERGDDVPTEHELGVLAQACGVAVFDLLPPGFSLRVLVNDPAAGPVETSGETALEALLREYLSMVVELRSGHAVTPPSLRYDDLEQLAAALGATPAEIETRIVELLGSDEIAARSVRTMVLPSTSPSTSPSAYAS